MLRPPLRDTDEKTLLVGLQKACDLSAPKSHNRPSLAIPALTEPNRQKSCRTSAAEGMGSQRAQILKKIRVDALLSTVRAEIIAELILKRAGPVIFKTFLLELIAFRPIPVICPAGGVQPENYWKR